MSLEWMAWTPITAGFFIVIFLVLVAMTVWQVVSPTVERKGFLPMRTTRGDRLFIGLLGSAYIYLAWLGMTDWSLWLALPLSLVFLVIVIAFG